MPDMTPPQNYHLTGKCPNNECGKKLIFCQTDVTVECPYCQRRSNQTDLLSTTAIEQTEASAEIQNLSFVRKLLDVLMYPDSIGEAVEEPKPTTVCKDSSIVDGLSNYHCNLISHLFTKYGMDKRTRKAKLLMEINREETFSCSVLADRAFGIGEDQLDLIGFGRDVSGSCHYLREVLKQMNQHNSAQSTSSLVPLHVDGDGHCLVHAISRAIVGRQIFWHPLRVNLKNHFEGNLTQYKEHFHDFISPDEWRDIIEECDPQYIPVRGEMLGLRNIHIFGLANILHRPIILLDSLAGMESSGDYSGIFLPAMQSRTSCQTKCGALNKPLVIAWSNAGHNHYVPLVPVINKESKGVSLLPPKLLPKVWGVPQSVLTTYMKLEPDGSVDVGTKGQRSVPKEYLVDLCAAMDDLFMEKYSLSPWLVSDFHYYIYKMHGVVSGLVTRPDTVLAGARQSVEKKHLHMCISCEALCEMYDYNDMAPMLERGGKYYQIAVDCHGKLLPSKRYAFPGENFTFSYNEKLDCLEPMLEHCGVTMPDTRCPYCNNLDTLRLVKKDGSPHYRNMDRTVSRLSSDVIEHLREQGKYCCDYKHFYKGVEYDVAPIRLPINMQWKGKSVQVAIPWFQANSNPDLNSNAYTIASQLVQEHFPGEFGSERLREAVTNQIFDCISLHEKLQTGDCDMTEPAEDAQRVDESQMFGSKTILLGPNVLHKEELGKCKTEKDIKHRVEENAADNQNRQKQPLAKDVPKKLRDSIVLEESPATCAVVKPVAVEMLPGDMKIRVSTSDGRQGILNISSGDRPVTLGTLQTMIMAEFGVDPGRQRIRHGFPPKLLSESGGDEVHLKHGDRLSVQVLPAAGADAAVAEVAAASKPHLMDEAMDESCLLLLQLMAEARKVSMWEVSCVRPELFIGRGVFCALVKDKVRARSLTELDMHAQLDVFPGKEFYYDRDSDAVLLCIRNHIHLPVDADVEKKVSLAGGAKVEPGGEGMAVDGAEVGTCDGSEDQAASAAVVEEVRSKCGPGQSYVTQRSYEWLEEEEPMDTKIDLIRVDKN